MNKRKSTFNSTNRSLKGIIKDRKVKKKVKKVNLKEEVIKNNLVKNSREIEVSFYLRSFFMAQL